MFGKAETNVRRRKEVLFMSREICRSLYIVVIFSVGVSFRSKSPISCRKGKTPCPVYVYPSIIPKSIMQSFS